MGISENMVYHGRYTINWQFNVAKYCEILRCPIFQQTHVALD